MNLFALDNDPVIAAQYNNDKHVVKMILECAQMLSQPFERKTGYDGSGPYKSCYKNHPVTVWVRKSRQNYLWTYEHAIALFQEKQHRFGGTHNSVTAIDWCKSNMDSLNLPDIGLTPFALAMPDECKVADPVQSYHNYYNSHKQDLAKWTKRDIPYFWKT